MRLFRVGPIVLGLIFAGAVCFRTLPDDDIGWHVAIGRSAAGNGISSAGALTWTAQDPTWRTTTWLFDAVSAMAWRSGGAFWLQCLMLTLVVLAVAGIGLVCHRVDRDRGGWMGLVISLLLLPRIATRPHVASWAVLAWVLWLCVPAGAAVSWRRRLACVPLIALGASFHSGAAFPAIVLAMFCVEAATRDGRPVRELLIAAAGLAAVLATPVGMHVIDYLMENVQVTGIAEMEPPSPVGQPTFFVALPLGLWAAWRDRRRSPTLGAAVVLFAVLALRAVRFTRDFEIVGGVALLSALAPIRERRIGWALMIAGGGLLVARGALLESTRFGSAFDANQLPVRAAEFVRGEKLSGPMFNAFRDGGYLEMVLPELRWFQDSRVQAFPPAFFRQQEAAESSTSAWQQWLREQGVEWAIVSRWPEHFSGNGLLDSPEWALVYWDETSEIRLRRDVDRFAPVIARREYRHFRPGAPIDIPSASPEALAEWDQELTRFEATAPTAAQAFIAHCAVRLRLHGDATVCRRAESLASTRALRESYNSVVRAFAPR